MSHRVERFTSTLRHSLTDILLNDVNNPHLKSVFITDVTVSPDLKRARVFVSAAGADTTDQLDDLIRRLERAGGFIKKTLGRKMYLKYIPELIFVRAEMPEPGGQKNE
jgi:ribosome-binding factor A